MGEAHASPDEEVRQTGEGQQPCEKLIADFSLIDEGEQAKGQLDDDAPDRSALLINIREEMRAHATRSKRLHRTRGAVSAGICYRKYGNGDDSIEDGREALDVRCLDSQDEW